MHNNVGPNVKLDSNAVSETNIGVLRLRASKTAVQKPVKAVQGTRCRLARLAAHEEEAGRPVPFLAGHRRNTHDFNALSAQQFTFGDA